jgi:hypothetical protein
MHGIPPRADDRKFARRPGLAALARRPGRAIPPIGTIPPRLARRSALSRLALLPAFARRSSLPVHSVPPINTVAAVLAGRAICAPLTGRATLTWGAIRPVATVDPITARGAIGSILAVDPVAAILTVLAVTTIHAVLAIPQGCEAPRDHLFKPRNQRHVFRAQFRNGGPSLRLDQFPLPAPLTTFGRDDLAESVPEGVRQLHGGLPRPLR